nr:helix-turn-helix domain-containing protein [Spirosoma utsteinense]
MTIKHLSASLGIDESTVYRLFLDHIGQSPKAYCQTVRFRQILTSLLAGSPDTLTQLAYTHDYFDQAHFGKHLKQVTGYSPGQLDQKLSIEQKELIWMTSSGSLA